MNAAQLINQTSGIVEYYTPPEIIAATRECMGNIDLDPASSIEANKRVDANVYFTEVMDGLSMKWFGNVWLNHPFGRKLNGLWIKKLVGEYEAGNIIQSCNITFAATSEQWFQPLLKRPQCFLCPRTNYLLPNGDVLPGVTKGSVVTYFGQNHERFAKAFKHLGTLKIAL